MFWNPKSKNMLYYEYTHFGYRGIKSSGLWGWWSISYARFQKGSGDTIRHVLQRKSSQSVSWSLLSSFRQKLCACTEAGNSNTLCRIATAGTGKPVGTRIGDYQG